MRPLKPGYSPEAEQQKLITAVCDYFGRVYDDEEEKKHQQLRGHHRGDPFWRECMGGLPTINETARHFHIPAHKVRKLLITGGFYRTEKQRRITEWFEAGEDIQTIGERLGMRPDTVRSYLPYERVIYNLEVRSVTADRLRRFKKKWGGYERPPQDIEQS